MFGADFTNQWLGKEGLSMLVRSHECMDEGFEWTHGKKVVTVFSASNYYEDESNQGAYMVLQKAAVDTKDPTKISVGSVGELNYYFTQYIAGDLANSSDLQKQPLSKTVGKLEEEAVKQLRTAFADNYDLLEETFKTKDADGTGTVSLRAWSDVLTEVLNLHLPWISLKGTVMCSRWSCALDRLVREIRSSHCHLPSNPAVYFAQLSPLLVYGYSPIAQRNLPSR